MWRAIWLAWWAWWVAFLLWFVMPVIYHTSVIRQFTN